MVLEDCEDVTSIHESLSKGVSGCVVASRRSWWWQRGQKRPWHNDNHGYLRSKKIN